MHNTPLSSSVLTRSIAILVVLAGLLRSSSVIGAPPEPPGPAKVAPSEPVRSDFLREKYELTPENHEHRMLRVVMGDREALKTRIQQAFLDYISSPESIQIDLGSPTTSQLLQGRFPRIEAHLANGEYDHIPVKEARLVMINPVIDYEELLFEERLRWKNQGLVSFFILIEEGPINKVILDNAANMKLENPKIHMRRDQVIFEGTGPGPFGRSDFRVGGQFQVIDGVQIHFNPNGIKIGILPIPGSISRAIFKNINPIADLGRMKVYIKPDEILAYPGRLYFLTQNMRADVDRIESGNRGNRRP